MVENLRCGDLVSNANRLGFTLEFVRPNSWCIRHSVGKLITIQESCHSILQRA